MDNANQELFSKQAEESLLGSVIIDPGMFVTLDVLPEHFYVHRHRFVWEAVAYLTRRGVSVDFVTLTEELERRGKLSECGGGAWLAGLVSVTPTSLNAGDYATAVKDYARRRQWRDLANRIAKLAYDRDASLELEAGDIIDDLLAAVQGDGAAEPIRKYAEQVWAEAFERRQNPNDIFGIQTGFVDFDQITGGLQPSEVLIVSGKPGVGKSIFAAQAAFQIAEHGVPVAIYSMEMRGSAMVRRRTSHVSSVPVRAIKSGRQDESQWQSFERSVYAIADLPIHMSDSVAWTTSSLRADLARLKAQHGIKVFILDYAYLLRDGEGMSENDKTGLISRNLKAICRHLDIAGIVIHSLRKTDKSVPGGEDLRGSNQQHYDTDLLLLAIEGEMPGTVTFVFGKGRELENPKQSFDLIKLPGFPAFGNAVQHNHNMADYEVRRNGKGNGYV